MDSFAVESYDKSLKQTEHKIMDTFAVGPSFKLQNVVFFARFWALLACCNMNNEYAAEKRQP